MYNQKTKTAKIPNNNDISEKVIEIKKEVLYSGFLMKKVNIGDSKSFWDLPEVGFWGY